MRDEEPICITVDGEIGPGGHVWAAHRNCRTLYCFICEGGLALCRRCGGLEGGLPTECPGERMSMDRIEEVYTGKIDFYGGEWTTEHISLFSPARIRGEK